MNPVESRETIFPIEKVKANFVGEPFNIPIKAPVENN
jgi:hypothetical protein